MTKKFTGRTPSLVTEFPIFLFLTSGIFDPLDIMMDNYHVRKELPSKDGLLTVLVTSEPEIMSSTMFNGFMGVVQ